jgi:hypothetical protein
MAGAGEGIPLRVPRTLHVALLAGVVLALGTLVWVQTLRLGGLVSDDVGRLLRYAGLAVLVGVVGGARVFRGRIPPLAAGADEGQWWRAHMNKAIIVWAMSESVALVNGVFYYLTGDAVTLGVAALGLVLLWVARPSRLLEG